MDDKTFRPGAVEYDGEIASSYLEARALSTDAVEAWFTALEEFIPRSADLTLIDLGCGTGRFCSLLATRFQAYVIGIDPAISMLQKAKQTGPSRGALYAVARGEQLPLRDFSCDVAWLSQVIHHITDLNVCAQELYRVLRPRGSVLIRGAFGDRLDGYPLFHFFPGAREVASHFPTLPRVKAVFQSAGFSFQTLKTVKQKTCNDLREFSARTRLRADTTLRILPDKEFQGCQLSLEQAATVTAPSPIIETIDLIVFESGRCARC